MSRNEISNNRLHLYNSYYTFCRCVSCEIILVSAVTITLVLTACVSFEKRTEPIAIQPALATSTLEPTFTPSPPPAETPTPAPTDTLTPEPTPPPTPTAEQASLSGRIFDQNTNQPIAEAQVRAGTSSATTDADGRYTLTGLQPGQYVLSVTHPDYDPGLSSIFTIATGEESSIDIPLYAPDTSPYPEDPMLTNPLDPNGASTQADAEPLARLQGFTGEVISIEETKLSGEFLVNYKIGDDIRAAVAEVRHEVWELIDEAGRKWWIIKVCGNLASRLPEQAPLATPAPKPLPPMAEVLVDGLVVRECAAENCGEVGSAPLGGRVEVFGCLAHETGDWCEVGWSGGRGWCTGQSLRQLAVVEAVPVVEAVLPTATPEIVAGGSKIFFLSNRGHPNEQISELYTMNPDGSQQTQITQAGISCLFLTWMTGNDHLFCDDSIIEVDTGTVLSWQSPVPTVVNNKTIGGFTWSPDGQQFAYLRPPFEQLYVVDADGSNGKILMDSDFVDWPSWSPNGDKIAFSNRSEVYTINPDGSGLSTIANVNVRKIAWSPDVTGQNKWQ